jgi:hypothetical protein
MLPFFRVSAHDVLIVEAAELGQSVVADGSEDICQDMAKKLIPLGFACTAVPLSACDVSNDCSVVTPKRSG